MIRCLLGSRLASAPARLPLCTGARVVFVAVPSGAGNDGSHCDTQCLFAGARLSISAVGRSRTGRKSCLASSSVWLALPLLSISTKASERPLPVNGNGGRGSPSGPIRSWVGRRRRRNPASGPVGRPAESFVQPKADDLRHLDLHRCGAAAPGDVTSTDTSFSIWSTSHLMTASIVLPSSDIKGLICSEYPSCSCPDMSSCPGQTSGRILTERTNVRGVARVIVCDWPLGIGTLDEFCSR